MPFIRNIPNQVVRGDDFFGRGDVLDRLFHLCATGSALLHGPRRMGKTSILRAMESAARTRGYTAASYVDVEDARAEVEFLHETHRQLPPELRGPVWKRIVNGPLKRLLGGAEIEADGLRVAFGAGASLPWREIGEELFDAVRAQDGRVLLLVDEFSVFLFHGFLAHGNAGRARAHTFLSWLLRQWQVARDDGATGSITWVFSGSIGLPMLFDRFRLGDTLGGLALVEAPPFDDETARRFVHELLEAPNVNLAARADLPAEIVQRLGWQCPQHIQHFVSLLADEARRGRPRTGRADATAEHVSLAWDAMLALGNRPAFDWWSQRIDEELDGPDAALARALLCACAADATGASFDTLTACAAAAGEATAARQRVASLLDVLEHDGYIVRGADRYRFRSHVLREYWRRRHCR